MQTGRKGRSYEIRVVIPQSSAFDPATRDPSSGGMKLFEEFSEESGFKPFTRDGVPMLERVLEPDDAWRFTRPEYRVTVPSVEAVIDISQKRIWDRNGNTFAVQVVRQRGTNTEVNIIARVQNDLSQLIYFRRSVLGTHMIVTEANLDDDSIVLVVHAIKMWTAGNTIGVDEEVGLAVRLEKEILLLVGDEKRLFGKLAHVVPEEALQLYAGDLVAALKLLSGTCAECRKGPHVHPVNRIRIAAISADIPKLPMTPTHTPPPPPSRARTSDSSRLPSPPIDTYEQIARALEWFYLEQHRRDPNLKSIDERLIERVHNQWMAAGKGGSAKGFVVGLRLDADYWKELAKLEPTERAPEQRSACNLNDPEVAATKIALELYYASPTIPFIDLQLVVWTYRKRMQAGTSAEEFVATLNPDYAKTLAEALANPAPPAHTDPTPRRSESSSRTTYPQNTPGRDEQTKEHRHGRQHTTRNHDEQQRRGNGTKPRQREKDQPEQTDEKIARDGADGQPPAHAAHTSPPFQTSIGDILAAKKIAASG